MVNSASRVDKLAKTPRKVSIGMSLLAALWPEGVPFGLLKMESQKFPPTWQASESVKKTI
jgi:hypothetical protein